MFNVSMIFILLFSLSDYFHSAEHEKSSSFRVQAPKDFAFLSAESSYDLNLSDTRKTETRRKFVDQQRARVLFDVLQTEEMLHISKRWSPLDPGYIKAVKYMNQRKYQQCLEKLHKLIIQRLFELHKMNISQTGKHSLCIFYKSLNAHEPRIQDENSYLKSITDSFQSYTSCSAGI